jgi:hypothetical protein
MTRLTIAEAPEQEFSVYGRNAFSEVDDEGLIFYNDVTKVQVHPDEQRFTVQVITPDLEVEMDFPDADSVREALDHFEAKKVSEVNAEAPGSVRITPLEPVGGDGEEQVVKPAPIGVPGDVLIAPDPESTLEAIPARADERPRENLPDTQTHK